MINHTGQVTTGGLSEASGTGSNTVWLLELIDVAAEGDVEVSIADFGDFTVTNNPRTVGVYQYAPAVFTDPVPASTLAGGTASFSVAPHSLAVAFQWQESTDGGATWNDVTNGGFYAGATADTLTLSGPPLSMNGYQYRCQVGDAAGASQASGEALLTVSPIPVTFTATQIGGVSKVANTTGIELAFSQSVTGLTAGHVTLSDGATGQATAGTLTDISGTGDVWLLEITGVAVEGDVVVSVSDFGDFTVSHNPQTVDVFRFVPVVYINQLVTLKQAKGGVATARPTAGPVGTTVVLKATSTKGYQFNGWQVSAAVSWITGNADSATASFLMPAGGVTVTPRFVLVNVAPPPPVKPPVVTPPNQPPPNQPPPNEPGDPPSAPPPEPGQTAPNKVPFTGDTQGANHTGLLLAALAGVYTLALWRRRQANQPVRPAPKHRAV